MSDARTLLTEHGLELTRAAVRETFANLDSLGLAVVAREDLEAAAEDLEVFANVAEALGESSTNAERSRAIAARLRRYLGAPE